MRNRIAVNIEDSSISIDDQATDRTDVGVLRLPGVIRRRIESGKLNLAAIRSVLTRSACGIPRINGCLEIRARHAKLFGQAFERVGLHHGAIGKRGLARFRAVGRVVAPCALRIGAGHLRIHQHIRAAVDAALSHGRVEHRAAVERIRGIFAHETVAALVDEDIRNLRVLIVRVAPGLQNKVDRAMEGGIGAMGHADANAVARVGFGRCHELGLQIPVLLLVIAESHLFVMVDRRHREHNALVGLVILLASGDANHSARFILIDVGHFGVRLNFAALFLNGLLRIRGPHHAAGLSFVRRIGDQVDAVAHVLVFHVRRGIAAEHIAERNVEAIGHPLQIVGRVFRHALDEIFLHDALGVGEPELLMQLCRVVGHTGDFHLPLRSAREHEHLFGAVFKRGIRSREARSAAATHDYIVLAVPLLGQTGSSGT